MRISQKIVKQTETALEFLDKATPIILNKHLTPIGEAQIAEFEKKTGKTVPADYRYWLVKCGSGIIEFTCSRLKIPSVEDLASNDLDGRMYSSQPRRSWKRISLEYAGTPGLLVLNNETADSDGCCPVCRTVPYMDVIYRIYASSWQMYIIWNVLTEATLAIEKNKFDFDRVEPLMALSLLRFDSIDTGLASACERIRDNNRTESSPEEIEQINKQGLINFSTRVIVPMAQFPQETKAETAPAS